MAGHQIGRTSSGRSHLFPDVIRRNGRPSTFSRQLCECSLHLTKPTNRLQRLFQSLQSDASTADALGVETVPQSPAELAELHLLINLLPKSVQGPLQGRADLSSLTEVVLDLGRRPFARFSTGGDIVLADTVLSHHDLRMAVQQVGAFGDDNRAGIDGTLHRISCIRNRDMGIVGLTCRVGRAIQGCASLAADFARAGKSILILGKPGMGKTTAIRELSRYLSDEAKRRVVIVDTSNEIGGDGDVPHSAVGGCRRLQVQRTAEQHEVMIEAVENHMPEVVVIDEIGTSKEALAARTISQRGVQLIGTAHGYRLENILQNPTLVELIGGVETVTIGDEAMKGRGLNRKTVRERAAPPSFDVAIELLDRHRWCVYQDVASAVDSLLQDKEPECEVRVWNPSDRTITVEQAEFQDSGAEKRPQLPRGEQVLSVYPVGLDSDKILAARTAIGPEAGRLRLVFDLRFADAVLALRSQMRPKSPAREAARQANVPVYAVKAGSSKSLIKALQTLLGIPVTSQSMDSDDEEEEPRNHVVSLTVARNEQDAISEARAAVINIVKSSLKPLELLPRAPSIVEKQASMLRAEFPEHSIMTKGKGLQTRILILPELEQSSKFLEEQEPNRLSTSELW